MVARQGQGLGMTANEHVKDRDEKKDQLSPQFEKGLEETAARCHSDEDFLFFKLKMLLKV